MFALLEAIGLLLDMLIIAIGLAPPYGYINGIFLGIGISLLIYDLYKLNRYIEKIGDE